MRVAIFANFLICLLFFSGCSERSTTPQENFDELLSQFQDNHKEFHAFESGLLEFQEAEIMSDKDISLIDGTIMYMGQGSKRMSADKFGISGLKNFAKATDPYSIFFQLSENQFSVNVLMHGNIVDDVSYQIGYAYFADNVDGLTDFTNCHEAQAVLEQSPDRSISCKLDDSWMAYQLTMRSN